MPVGLSPLPATRYLSSSWIEGEGPVGYLWVKALHVISIIAWMAGLLYLPRLYVYHSAVKPGSEASETFKVMERRLLRAIMNPAMIAAWVFGMIVVTPLWALIEWQDNGDFERFSANSRPGSWEPWILYVLLIWGFFVALDALKVLFDRPTTEVEVDRQLERLRSR